MYISTKCICIKCSETIQSHCALSIEKNNVFAYFPYILLMLNFQIIS